MTFTPRQALLGVVGSTAIVPGIVMAADTWPTLIA